MKKLIILSSIVLYALSLNAQQTVFEKTIQAQTTDSILTTECGIQCHDGGYMLAGYYQPNGVYAQEMLLIKTDSLGNEVWRKFYGAVPAVDNIIRGIAQLPDSSYVCAAQGSFQQPAPGYLAPLNALIFRVDKNGNMMWHKEIDCLGYEYIYDLAVSDTGFIAVGWSMNRQRASKSIWIVSDFEGDSVHTNIDFVGTYVQSAYPDNNGGYVLGAQDGTVPFYIKLDQMGTIMDTAYIGDITPYPYGFYTNDHIIYENKIYGCGRFSCQHACPIVFEIDSNLNLADSAILKNDYPHNASGKKISFCRDSQNFVIAGLYTSENRKSELFIQKMSLDLESQWYHTIGSIDTERIFEIISTNDGGYLLIGETDDISAPLSFPKIYLVKTDSLGQGNYTSDIKQNLTSLTNASLYPNPAKDYCYIDIPDYKNVDKVLVYDLSGKLLLQKNIENKKTKLNLKSLNTGMYIITDNKKQFRNKLLIH